MKKSLISLVLTSFLLLAIATSCRNNAQTSVSLPRSTPEAEGVSSEAVITFLDSAATGVHEFHGFMFLRHGKVIAEGWWYPYRADLRHTLYSTSKSFTSTAVGLAVSEKRISVDDKVTSFFPDQLPDSVSPFLAEMTVKDLLTMSAGQSPDPTGVIASSDSSWVKAFLALPVLNEPGSTFLYNSMASFMLSAIVQKVTGQKVIDYLQPRLFAPLAITGIDWEVSPEGINTGGWGLRLKTEDMAKFGQLLLQKGMWNGRQVIPTRWVEEATTFKIDQAPDAPQSKRDSSDWLQGYCYQFWRCRNNAFRADGAYGQFIIVMPDKDAVVAITAESPDMQDEINMVWKYLLPDMKDEPLPDNTTAAETMKDKLASLTLPLAAKGAVSPLTSTLKSKTFSFENNNLNLESFSIDFTGDTCNLSLKVEGKDYNIPFGEGKWIISRTDLSGPNLISKPGALSSNITAGSYSWKDDSTLELVLRYIESPHHLLITCLFNEEGVDVRVHLSIPPGIDLPPFRGTVMK
jgi:CubicO group peptidase (beta-lactamase class C family)